MKLCGNCDGSIDLEVIICPYGGGDVSEVAMRKRIFDSACWLSRSVPAYKLRVSLTGRVWELMEEVL